MNGVPHHSLDCPMYLVVSAKLVEELIPVLLVVIDTEVSSNIDVQQEPAGAVEPELVVGVWEGDRRLCQIRIPTRQGRPGSVPTTTASLGTLTSAMAAEVAARPPLTARTHHTCDFGQPVAAVPLALVCHPGDGDDPGVAVPWTDRWWDWPSSPDPSVPSQPPPHSLEGRGSVHRGCGVQQKMGLVDGASAGVNSHHREAHLQRPAIHDVADTVRQLDVVLVYRLRGWQHHQSPGAGARVAWGLASAAALTQHVGPRHIRQPPRARAWDAAGVPAPSYLLQMDPEVSVDGVVVGEGVEVGLWESTRRNGWARASLGRGTPLEHPERALPWDAHPTLGLLPPKQHLTCSPSLKTSSLRKFESIRSTDAPCRNSRSEKPGTSHSPSPPQGPPCTPCCRRCCQRLH